MLELLPTDRPHQYDPWAYVLRHSSVIRRGLAEGVALVGSLEDDDFNDRTVGADHPPVSASASCEWRTWIDPVKLAVACGRSSCPLLRGGSCLRNLLDAVNDDLDQAEPLLSRMFQDRDRGLLPPQFLSPHRPVVGSQEGFLVRRLPIRCSEGTGSAAQLLIQAENFSDRPMEKPTERPCKRVRRTGASVPLKTNVITQMSRPAARCWLAFGA